MRTGRFRVTGRDDDVGAFKTPTLREVARTAPYMHDGSLATLAEVTAFYDRGGNPNPYLDREIHPLKLTGDEQQALIAFLRALSGEVREGLSNGGGDTLRARGRSLGSMKARPRLRAQRHVYRT